MGVTQKEIAQHLGVSRPLVAHALSGRPGVSEETRERVLAAARHFGYDAGANREARALIARRYHQRVRNNLIAIFTDSYATGGPMRNAPYFGPIFEGIEEEASRRDLDALFCAYRSHRLPRFLQNREVDGVISVNAPEDLAEPVRRLKIPLVSIGVRMEEASLCLVPDDSGGMDAAVAHLVELGHRRIGYLSPARYTLTVRDRSDGFRRAIAAHGLPDNEDHLQASGGGIDPEHGAAGMALLLERFPDLTAVVCYNDTLAMGAVRHLVATGRRVPQSVSVIGFDDTSVRYGFTPALTSVSAPRVEMGRESVRYLLEQELQDSGDGTNAEDAVAGGAVTRPEVRLFPVTLVVRDTTAPPPA